MAYINPVLRGWNPDPSVCRRGDEFFMVTSTFMYFPGLPIYRSKDLVHWELLGHALNRKSQLNFSDPESKNEIFAATLRYHDGLFYIITTDVGGMGNFIVTAEDPAGPWSDPIVVDKGLFDPTLLFDGDGRVYYTRRGRNGIVQAEIDPSTGLLRGPLREISRGFVSEDTEGPHLYNIRGRYYLLTAEGGSRYGHMAAIGRSDNPWGPFEPSPHNPILTQRDRTFSPIRDTGHAELIEDLDGRWWMFFLGTRNWTYSSFAHLGRETHLLPVTWSDDGWPLLAEGGRARPLVGGHGSIILGKDVVNDQTLEEQDDWTDLVLDGRWIAVRRDPQEFCHWGNGLELQGAAGSTLESPRPALLARRLTAFGFEAEICVELPKEAACKDELEAGLCLYLDGEHHYEAALGISGDGTTTVSLKKHIEDIQTETGLQELEKGIRSVRLGVLGTEEGFLFRFALDDGASWEDLGTAVSKLLWPELASQWTGTVVGVYAEGGRARFSGWRYRETESRWWKLDGSIPERIQSGAEA